MNIFYLQNLQILFLFFMKLLKKFYKYTLIFKSLFANLKSSMSSISTELSNGKMHGAYSIFLYLSFKKLLIDN